ncbi:hypothetical protein ACLKA6_012878 [Drosophila palustris]
MDLTIEDVTQDIQEAAQAIQSQRNGCFKQPWFDNQYDMVMLADSPESLQKMINFTYNYTIIWNLQINLDNSKIMCIKDTRGRLAGNEKWTLNGSEIEVVKEYKYLGAVLTPTMSFHKHLQQKLKEAKAAINSTWSSFLAPDEYAEICNYA